MLGARWLVCATLAAAACGATSCDKKEPQASTYFDRSVAPILQSSCVRTNTGAGCHVADTKGNAFGNLDLESFEGISLRRDLLLDYGPYLQPAVLAKNVPPFQVTVELWDGTSILVTTDIKHTGGPILDPTRSAYQVLRAWIENGATINNTGVAPVLLPTTPCSDVVPVVPGFDPNGDPQGADYATFQTIANPVLSKSCAAGNCHGTTVNALYLTCGTTPREIRWNYFAAVDYLAATAEQSEILRRPLATAQGGSYHEGGPLFASVTDVNYAALESWAAQHGPPQPPALDPAFVFFAQKVQPILVKKGCMMVQCHSAGMFHDYRLRGGSAGSFALNTTRRNYTFTVGQMSFESDDVNASRLVRKNLYPPDRCATGMGLTHRGGSLLEDFANEEDGGTACDPSTYGKFCDQGGTQGPYDYDHGNVDAIPPYCVIREWHRRERVERNLSPLSAIAYVSRPVPAAPDRPQDFDVFASGASLHIVPATMVAGQIELGADKAVDLSACGLGASSDIRRPAVSWDGTQIAFAARATVADPLAIYTVAADGSGCAKQPDIAGHMVTDNGLLEHDFDPAFSPPDANGVERIVFASTRGNLDPTPFDYSGPQPTPADPTKPNANLYVLDPPPSVGAARPVRQLTWQLNMERMPSFMQDGRVVFTVEKREPGFYELALRRQNLDGGDYHPLYAQRASIGYTQATSAVELADKNFAAIFSNRDAQHGAGSLVIFNRSIGVDFSSDNSVDYPIDPSVIDPTSSSSLESAFFLHSLDVVATDGSYTSPSPLPDGDVLVSFGAGAPASFGGDYDVYVVNPIRGTKTKLLGSVGAAELDAVAVYARAPKGIFASTPDEPNGHTFVDSTTSAADVTVLNAPILASLLFQNTPTGRFVESDLGGFDIYEDLPPDVTSFPANCTGFCASDVYGQVYTRRRLLGRVPFQSDGSAHFRVPGGLPIVLHLANDAESLRTPTLPRWQREAMTFYPGEVAHQSFPRAFFDNLCAGCHGSISGRPTDTAVSPDFLTQASAVVAAHAPAADYSGPPTGRGTLMGPPFSP